MTGANVDRPLPPVAEIATGALALIVVGGIVMASYLPRRPPLGLPVGLLAAAGLLLAVDAVLLAGLRRRPFAWSTFLLVEKWAILAYGVIAGILEYVFVFDGTRGAVLAVLTLMLVVFATAVPTIIAFTVARHQVVGPVEPGAPTPAPGASNLRSA